MHPFREYTLSHLPFHKLEERMCPSLPQQDVERHALRLSRAGQRAPEGHVALLGLGSGVLARELAQRLPQETPFTVLDVRPERVQALLTHAPQLLDWWQDAPQRQILADSSPWSLLLMLHARGALSRLVPLRNPELAAACNNQDYARLQKMFLLVKEERLQPSSGDQRPRVSAAAILRPDEPGLDAFFAQFPAWLHELVVVWDAAALPAHAYAPLPMLREVARPLNEDFGAQRNAMLKACAGVWIFFLDGDERFAPGSWDALQELTGQDHVHSYWFPRRTFYPDKQHAMAGMGLWPDLQLRLFRNTPQLRFANRLHERLQGLRGGAAIVPWLPIEHLNQVERSEDQIRAKLAFFSQAGGIRHQRSRDYPRLPLCFFQQQENAALTRGVITFSAPLSD